MKRFISTSTILEPYGLVRISGEVEKNADFDGWQQEPGEQPFYVRNLKVIGLKGLSGTGNITDDLEPFEIQKCEEVLIEKFTDDEGSALDYMIDEAIERGREYARKAYA